MKPPRFEYHRPATLDEALELLGRYGADAAILAGGQSLIPMMSMRLAMPGVLIDVNRVAGLSGIRRVNGTFVIGALTRHRDVEQSADLLEAQPALPDAVSHIGHVTIRNRGTVGGSLAHADPSAELGTAGLALGVDVLLRGARGDREMPLDDFFLGSFSTAIQEGELLTQIRVPSRRSGEGAAFIELARTHGNFAVAAVCAHVRLVDGVVADARIALGGVAPTPVRAREAEEALVGSEPTAVAFGAAAEAIDASIRPTDDVQATAAYRRQVVKVLAGRALETATARAREGSA